MKSVKLKRRCQSLRKKIKECDDELAIIFSVYEKKLNNTIFVFNGTEILQNIIHHYSSGLIEILTNVKEKANRINIIIERLNKQIEEEGFNVFISSKSQDYKKAFEVYSFLLENGYKPFLADPVLREIGTDYYGYLIRRIVNKSSFMIVYASEVNYITTPYVSAEWNQFLDELNSGIKYGKLFSTLFTILCKWKQDSVVSFLLYLYSVFKNKHKLVHNQSPVMNRLCPFLFNFHQ